MQFNALIAFFALFCLVSASHFRYASIQWEQTGTLTVSFSVFSAWDGGAQNPSFNLVFGDGTFSGNILGSAASSVDQFGGYDVYHVSKLNHTYASPGPWTVSINACCREEALLNVGQQGSRYIISSTVYCDPYIYRRSPVSMIPPVLQFQQQTENTFALPIVYPDGLNPSDFTCSFSTTTASGIPFNPPFSTTAGSSLVLTNNGAGGCSLYWDLRSTSKIEGYAVQITIASPINSISISLDFIIGIILPGNYDCNFASNPNLVLSCDLQNCPTGADITWSPSLFNSEVFLINAIPSNVYGFSLNPSSGRAIGPGTESYATTVGLSQFTFASEIPNGVTNIECPQNCDDYCLTDVSLGFSFQFYGDTFSTVSLSSNGLLYFGSSCPINSEPRRIPDGSSGNFIAALWADLEPIPSTWWYTTVTENGSKVFLFTFENATYFDDSTSVQVQLRLFEVSNRIEVHIQSAPAERQAKSRSIGIEKTGGSIGVQSYFGPAAIEGIAYSYVPSDNIDVQLQVSLPTLKYPDAYVGYVLFEEATPCLFSRYISQEIVVDFIPHELVPLATNLTTCDDCCGPLTTIGFDFLFFGDHHSTITPESNGFLTVADDCQSVLPEESINSAIPSSLPPNQMIAAQLADLDITTPGSWWYSTIGQTPNRQFLLTYEGVNYFESTQQTTFQIKLFETSSVIEVHIVSAPASGVIKTVGIENTNGTIGIQSLRTTLPIIKTAFRYTPICDRRDIYCPYTIKTTRNCDLTVSFTTAPPTCDNGQDGKITLTTNSQYGIQNINWIDQNFASTNQFQGPVGAYSVVVTDNGGCQKRLNISIPAATKSPFTVSATGINPICANTGQATYQTAGVLSQITWFGTGIVSQGTPGLLKPNVASLSSLGPGNYFARAYFPFTDPTICYETNTIALSGASTQLSSTFQTQDVNCFGQNTGSINVQASGGIPPYTITWSGGPIVVAPGDIASNLIAGAYNYTLSDSVGCVNALRQVIIDQPSQIVVSQTLVQAPTCANRQDGSLSFAVTGGNGPYQVSWLDYDSDLNEICCLSRNYLGAGTYRLQVTDQNGCQASGVGNVPSSTTVQNCLRARRNPAGLCNGVPLC